MHNAAFWIKQLGLEPHVEGGAYKQVYTSTLLIPRDGLPETFHGPRPASTSIFFLLQKGEYSALHRLAADEIWHFYAGDPLYVFEIKSDGTSITHRLGNNPLHGESFQCCIKAGSWFGSMVAEDGEYSLAGCTVAPGFDFEDFELADRDTLLQQYPMHAKLIEQLTPKR